MTTAGLLSLFIGSVLASSVLPGGVEVLLYAMVDGGYRSLVLLVVATVGNTIGGVTTFAVGVLLHHGVDKVSPKSAMLRRIIARFRLSENALTRVQRFGAPCLLLSWLPIIGDPLCLAAGYLRLAFWRCALAICAGKFLRYLVLLYLFGWR